MTLSRTNPRAKPRWLMLLAVVAGMLVLVSGTALAVLPSSQGVFELDGNAQNDNAVAGDDWSNLWEGCPSGTNSTVGGNFVECSFVGQGTEGLGSDASYFTGGGSKDVNDVTQWRYNGNAVPDKNQITNAYAAQYSKDGRQLVYFGADRYSNDGDSSLGFWFFKGNVSLGANGTFSGTHENGDIFIVSDFSNGGSIGTVVAYRWMNGALTGPIGQGGDCATAPSTANVCARVNGSATAAPWPYNPKPNVGSEGTLPTNTFFEGGIDLTALAGGQTCFSTFLAETRSSTSTTAQLKDFALGSFDTCDARISITPSGVNAVGTAHDFTVTVERSFGGAFEGVSGVVVNGSLVAGSTLPNSALNPASCTTNSSGQCTLTVNSTSAGVAVVSATAEVPFPGAGSETVTTNGQGSAGPATKRFVDATIAIGSSAVNAVGNAHTFNISVTPHAAGTTVSNVSITPALSPARVEPQTSSTTCGAPTVTSGVYTCTLTVNSPTATTFTANASTTVTFTGSGTPPSAQVERSTSGNSGPGGSGAATKRFVDARIKIEPPLDTNGIGESHTVTVSVEKDLGAGGGWEALAGATPAVTLSPSGGAAVASKVDNCVSPGGTGSNGQCTVTFTSNSAGTVTGAASVTVTVDGQSITRSTTAAHGGIPASSAVKHFVAGTLKWLKHDQDGNLLGGATFEVCRTHRLDSSEDPDAFVPLSPAVCVAVTDNSAPDTDSTAGELQLGNLILGKYTITETEAPAGYAKSSATLNATLDLSNLPSSATVEAGTFVNVRLFKMIVITCNQSANELVLSTVTLSGHAGSPKDTLTASDLPNGVTAQQLCNLGGANYGNLNQGTYAPSVVIPKSTAPGP